MYEHNLCHVREAHDLDGRRSGRSRDAELPADPFARC